MGRDSSIAVLSVVVSLHACKLTSRTAAAAKPAARHMRQNRGTPKAPPLFRNREPQEQCKPAMFALQTQHSLGHDVTLNLV